MNYDVVIESTQPNVGFLNKLAAHLTAMSIDMAKSQKVHLFKDLTISDVSRIIEMAWEDRTPFDAIKNQFNLGEQSVINLMRSELSDGAFRNWRKRVSSRKTKHISLRLPTVLRGYCSTQYKVRSKTR